MNEKVLYEELTPAEFRERVAKAPIAYLPLGTLEWHGAHLPLGADGLQSKGFFVELAKEAGGVVLPMLFLGPDKRVEHEGKEYFGMDFYGFKDAEPQQLDGSAYWVPDEFFKDLLRAVMKQLKRAGFKVVVGHGHGPSGHAFEAMHDEFLDEFGLETFHCWRPREEEKDGLGIQTDHAAANETSLVMALRPELVQMKNLPENPDEWPVAIGGRDPRIHASAETGKKAIAMQKERMAGLLMEALARLRG